MATCWETELILILRHLIDDLDSSTYSDSRLMELLLVSAQLIQTTIQFSNTYVVDVDSLSLDPNPTTEPKDKGFILLTCYKAACILRGSEYKSALQSGFKVSDGQSSLDSTGTQGGYKSLMESACKEYESAKKEYLITGNVSGRAIIGPFSSPNVYTNGHWGSQRGRTY